MRPATALLFTATLAAAQKQNQTLNDDFACEDAGAYTLCQNLWGKATGSGNQSTTLVNAMGSGVSWATEYSWDGEPHTVKSYANVEHKTAKGVQLADVKSIPTVWTWRYQSQSDSLRADVAYDLWLGSTPNASPASADSAYEIMIWLSNVGGAWPIGSRVVSGVVLGNVTWDLWSGPNSWHVFSFVSAQGDINNFSADLGDFMSYLVTEQGVKRSQYIQSLQAGTEPFVGSAEFITTAYSIAVTTDEDDEPSAPTSSPDSSSSTRSPVRTSTSTSTSIPHATPSTSPAHSAVAFHHCALRKPSKLEARSFPTSPAVAFAVHRRKKRRSAVWDVLRVLWRGH